MTAAVTSVRDSREPAPASGRPHVPERIPHHRIAFVTVYLLFPVRSMLTRQRVPSA
jgi:hypothetical protein